MEYLTHAAAFWLGAGFITSEALRMGGSKNSLLVDLCLCIVFWPILLWNAHKKRSKANGNEKR